MGRITPSRDNVLKSARSATRLGNLKQGDQARLLCLEIHPDLGTWAEWRVALGVDEKSEEMPDGSRRVVREEKFLGYFIVPGDTAAIAEHGYDPDLCPWLTPLVQQDDSLLAKRYHATNVIQYATKDAKTTELARPYSVSHKVWVLSEFLFDKVMAVASEWGADLRKYDLLITCTNPRFQNYDVAAARVAAWLAPEYNQGEYGINLSDLAAQTYKENRLADQDLSRVIGNTVSPDEFQTRVMEYANLAGLQTGANRSQAAVPDTVATAAGVSTDDITAMLGTPPEQQSGSDGQAEPAAEAPAATPAEDDGAGQAEAQEAASTEEAPTAPAGDEKPVAEERSLSDILGQS